MAQSAYSCLVLARKVADLMAASPQVEAIALGGSQVSGVSDVASDVDLYVYTRADIPLAERQAVVDRSGGASRASLGLAFWGPGDEWLDAATGIEVDVVYFGTDWIEGQLNRVLRDHRASLGYSTCFWYTVRRLQALYDPHGWLQGLQMRSQQEYPEALRRHIIALNHPVLRNVIPAYTNQLEKAVKRRDLLSVNHRLAALFASYFDVLFAVNRMLHPGEKQLVAFALAHCDKLPAEMAADIDAVLRASATADQRLMTQVSRLLDHLDQLLQQEGFDPYTSRPRTAT